MNLRRIVENFRSFTHTQPETWLLGEMLTAIFNNIVSLEFRSDAGELLDRSRFELYTMYDFVHDVSRACELHVLTFDDKPVAAVVRYGKQDYTGIPLDSANMATVAGELAAAAIRNDIANLKDVDLDEKLSQRTYPMQFLDSEETMFVLEHPRNVYRLEEMRQRHPVYFVDETGQAQKVEKIGDFQQKHWVDGKPPSNELVAVTIDGAERFVDATQLMFELVAGQGDVDVALQWYNRPHSWKVTQLAPRVNRITIGITEPYRWNQRTIWVEFNSAEAMEEFVRLHPLRESTPGVFSEAILAQNGRIHILA